MSPRRTSTGFPLGSATRSLLAVMLGCATLLVIAPSALAQTGSIEGEVTGFESKKGLPNVTVTAYRENGAVAGSAKTEATGKYKVGGLAGGFYVVEFSGTGFVPQYFFGRSSFAEADRVLVMEGAPKGGVNAVLMGGGELSGRVTDAATNLPAANVSVKATNTKTGASFPSWSVVTDGNGEYKMLGLEPEPGSYKVEFASAEPSAAQYVSQTLTGIVVKAIGTKGINVALVRKPPVNTAPPVLSGTPALGQKLACSNGSWTGFMPLTFGYAWLREGGAISGANGNTYVVQPADQGRGLACQVTATNGVVSASATSNTLKVPPAPPPSGPPPSPPLKVERVSQSNSRWRGGNRLATYSRTMRPPVGTTFTFVLNQRATVSFAFTQQVGGRRVNGRCVAQTNGNRRRPSCKRTVTRGTLTFNGRSGLNKVVFQGRISGSKRLPLGAYTLQVTARNSAGQRASGRSLNFTIVR
jgi:5-hydroxyisourate hydrolase-like protein (transthyretin family)